MYKMILLALLFYGIDASAQVTTRRPVAASDSSKLIKSDADIKAQLIALALKNPQAIAAEANVQVAKIARRKAGSAALSSLSVSGNVNEFVINESPAANFFPKYNFGLAIPLDLFSRTRAEKRTAGEQIKINSSEKQLVEDALKARVLVQYEIYKEKKQLLELQRIVTNDDNAAYEKAQNDYKADRISIEDVNKIYRELITSKGFLATTEKDLNIAIVEIEQIIRVPLQSVLENRSTR
jgi:outer membrane protein TolC